MRTPTTTPNTIPTRTVAEVGWCASCGRRVPAGRQLYQTRRNAWVCRWCC